MTKLPAGTKRLLLRLAGSILLAGALLAVFLPVRNDAPPRDAPDPAPEAPGATVAGLDAGIDSVLSNFGIAASSVKKRSVDIPGEAFSRTERLVSIPDTLVPVAVNAALNTMARRLGARAVASENPRLRTVTIHLELGGAVVHTVILRKLPPGISPADGRLRPAT